MALLKCRRSNGRENGRRELEAGGGGWVGGNCDAGSPGGNRTGYSCLHPGGGTAGAEGEATGRDR